MASEDEAIAGSSGGSAYSRVAIDHEEVDRLVHHTSRLRRSADAAVASSRGKCLMGRCAHDLARLASQ